MLAGADDGYRITIAIAAPVGDGYLHFPREVGASQRRSMCQNILHGTFGNHLSAVFSRAGPQVNDPICGFDSLRVMLDHQDGIAQVT